MSAVTLRSTEACSERPASTLPRTHGTSSGMRLTDVLLGAIAICAIAALALAIRVGMYVAARGDLPMFREIFN
jgi:hypothetical protein